MRKFICILLIFSALPAFSQTDRKEVRSGNRKFGRGEFASSEIEYRKAVLKDSLSVAGQYDLASALYRQQNYEEAAEALGNADAEADGTPHAASYYYNEGDVALQRKDYGAAVKAFRQSLLLNPSDMDAKENYIYAKEMLKNRQGGGQDQNQDQNQDQDQQQDQNQNQDQNQDQNQQQDQNQNPEQQQDQPQDQSREGQQGISKQQARQMLNAVQAQEKETQDKVNKEKAAVMKSRQKDKNW